MKSRFDLHPSIKADWAHRLQGQRERLYPRQRDLADAMGVGISTVCRWETGQVVPNDAEKVRLAQLLGMEVGDLFPLNRGTGIEVAA